MLEKGNDFYIKTIEDLISEAFGVNSDVFYNQKYLYKNTSIAFGVLVYFLYDYMSMTHEKIATKYNKGSKSLSCYKRNKILKLDKEKLKDKIILDKINQIKEHLEKLI